MEGGALDVFAEARLDFAGGAIGEAEAKHALGLDAVFDGAGGTLGKGHRLAGADRGHDKHGLVPRVDDEGLQVVELHELMITRGG